MLLVNFTVHTVGFVRIGSQALPMSLSAIADPSNVIEAVIGSDQRHIGIIMELLRCLDVKTHNNNKHGVGLSITYYDPADGSVLGGAGWTTGTPLPCQSAYV